MRESYNGVPQGAGLALLRGPVDGHIVVVLGGEAALDAKAGCEGGRKRASKRRRGRGGEGWRGRGTRGITARD